MLPDSDGTPSDSFHDPQFFAVSSTSNKPKLCATLILSAEIEQKRRRKALRENWRKRKYQKKRKVKISKQFSSSLSFSVSSQRVCERQCVLSWTKKEFWKSSSARVRETEWSTAKRAASCTVKDRKKGEWRTNTENTKDSSSGRLHPTSQGDSNDSRNNEDRKLDC